MSKLIVVSIKPEFAHKIFDGSKKIELRKVSPNVRQGDLMIVYSTSPEMAILGICQIQEVIKSTPSDLWEKHSDVLGIDKTRYFDYYSKSSIAIGIVLERAKRFKTKIPLKNLKKYFPTFSPPQTFKYYNRELVSSSLTHYS
ncbi:MAG: EVE domain-containing protein [Cyclobacteriaceae bacterium]